MNGIWYIAEKQSSENSFHMIQICRVVGEVSQLAQGGNILQALHKCANEGEGRKWILPLKQALLTRPPKSQNKPTKQCAPASFDWRVWSSLSKQRMFQKLPSMNIVVYFISNSNSLASSLRRNGIDCRLARHTTAISPKHESSHLNHFLLNGKLWCWVSLDYYIGVLREAECRYGTIWVWSIIRENASSGVFCAGNPY